MIHERILENVVMVRSFRHAALKAIVFVDMPEMSREPLFVDGPLCSCLLPSASVLLPALSLDDATNMQPYAFAPAGGEAPFVFDLAFLAVFDRALKQTYR